MPEVLLQIRRMTILFEAHPKNDRIIQIQLRLSTSPRFFKLTLFYRMWIRVIVACESNEIGKSRNLVSRRFRSIRQYINERIEL